jgi:hypothetical protein
MLFEYFYTKLLNMAMMRNFGLMSRQTLYHSVYYFVTLCNVVSCLCRWGWDYVSELRPPVALLFVLQVTHEYWAPRWKDVDGRNRGTREKPVRVPLQIPHGQIRAQTPNSVVRDRRLTAWAILISYLTFSINAMEVGGLILSRTSC